jgi:hypothetical protein
VTGADSRYASACSQFYSPPGCWVGFILRNAVIPDRSAGRPPHVTGASVTAHYAPLLAPHRACLDPPLSGGVLAILKVICPGWPAARRAVRRLRANAASRSSGSSNGLGPCLTAALEELHRALVLYCLLARIESAQVPALSGLRIDLSRIESVTARLQLADHGALTKK